MPSRTSSLAGRAVLAIVLLVGFYVLAVVIAGVLLFLPYAELRWGHRLHLQLALFAIVGAGVVLYSAFPRPDRFAAPGPLLRREDQPRLFAVLEDLAARVGQAMPAEVYLIPVLNAWVAQRGGAMGLGGRRVMAIGMPVLYTLSVSELKAVLAHEFGHFHGGDTNLGVFVYQTRAAIQRTVHGLASSDDRLASLSIPFIAYGKMFLRVTQKVSRAQETDADELAARTVGRGPLIEGLKKLHVMDAAYDSYMRGEFGPAAGFGLVPPVTDGFVRFLAAGSVREKVDELLAGVVEAERKEVAEGTDAEALAYESHPRLHERIDALVALDLVDPPLENAAAATLLEDAYALDLAMSRHLLGEEGAAVARAVSWDEVGPAGYLVHYREQVAAIRHVLEGVAIGDLAARYAELRQPLSSEFEKQARDAGFALEAGAPEAHAQWLLGAALTAALCDHGYTVFTAPGESLELRGPGGALDPFGDVRAMATGTLDAAEWRRRYDARGLGSAPLVT